MRATLPASCGESVRPLTVGLIEDDKVMRKMIEKFERTQR